MGENQQSMKKIDHINVDWGDATQYTECGWHQLSPYIGKMKSSMARSLVNQFTRKGDIVYDPFSGAGTVALEAWISGRNVIASDLSPYAFVLSKGKTMPPKNLQAALKRLDRYWLMATEERSEVDLRKVPKWVRKFFHRETLREVLAIRKVLLRYRQWFLLSCLLGILHHWRPGFLSHPCSHTVPYLKSKLYPSKLYPELYCYRAVYARLCRKVERAYKRCPDINHQLLRNVKQANATSNGLARSVGQVSAIITSPPYMNSLSYARDNRLRLWFLGVEDHTQLEPSLSPRKQEFLLMMRHLLIMWSKVVKKNGPCVLVLGAVRREGKYHDLPGEILDIATRLGCGWQATGICRNVIPDIRRARINCCSTREDTILILRKGR